MRIPAVLSTVRATIDQDGHLAIDIDGHPHPTPHQHGRGDLRSVLEEIAADLRTPVRVEVHEHDGTTYSDIITPPATPYSASSSTPQHDEAPAPPAAGLSGAGFHPGENVAVAIVICTQTAGDDGRAVVHLPPALLAREGIQMLLVGMTSAAVATIEPT